MAKTFKRTLIATLSVLCLLALSLFAAACSPAADAYKVTLDYESEKGEVTLDPVQDTYDAGSDVTVTVTPKPNYEVGTFKVDGKDEQLTNGKYTFAVEKDTVVAVTFTQKITTEDNYLITVTPTQNGTVVLSDPGPVASGTEITATVTPAPGYELDTAKVNGADVTVDGNNRFKFTVTADTTVTVTFKEIPVTKYNVSAAATQNGTVTLDPEGEVAVNTEVTVTIAPATGYELDTAKVNDDDVTDTVEDNTFKFTVTADTTVTVTFKETTPPAPTTYNVSAASTTHGSVTLDHEGEVAVNTEVTVTITPDGGYELDTAKVNDDDVTDTVEDNTFKFTVTEDTVVTVTFKETTPPAPPLDIDEKWDGTFIGTNDEDDSEWKIDIDAENDTLTFYINDVDQHVSSVAFAPRDPEDFSSMGDAYYFTHGEDTLYIYKRAADDDGKIYQIVVYVYSDVETSELTNTVELIDESKVPPEPPLGDTITAFPADFRGTWYGTDYDDVDYVIDIQETTMTITVGDGDPTTIDVKDVLYNAHEGSMWEDPTLYFTYKGAEESTLELGYDNTLTFTSDYDYIYANGFTHDKPVHYGDATAFLAEIEGVWSYPSTYYGDTLFVVVDGDVTQFEFEGTDYTSSIYVHGLDEDGALVVEAGDELYHFTYDAENEALTVTNASGSEHELTKSEIKNTLPSEYVGKWVKINGEPYIVVAQDGTAKYYSDASDSGTDLKIVGTGSSYTFDYIMFDDGVIALHENNRVLSVDALNFAKEDVEIPEAEKLPEDLRGTTWECAVSFDIDTFVFETDGLTITADGDVKYHVYFVSHDSSSDAYTFNAYSGGDVYSFEYTHGALYVNAEYTFLPAEGGDEGGLAEYAGTYQEANGTRTIVIGEDGSVTVDGTPADSVESYGDGSYEVTVGEDSYDITPTDYIVITVLTLSNGETQAFFVPNDTEETAINAVLVGTWKGTADNWSDPMATTAFGDITLVVNDDGSATLNGEDTFVFYGLDSVSDTYSQYSYYLVGTSEMFGSLIYSIIYIPGEDPNVISCGVLDDAYYIDLEKDGGSVVPGTAIDESLYGVWRGNNGGDSYVVTIDAEGVHFARNSGTSVDGTVHDIAADGLSFDVEVLFPQTQSPYNFHAVYSASTGNLTLTEGQTKVVLTKDSADMETIPESYRGKWSLVQYGGSKVIGSMEITKNTISMTLNGESYGPISITLDDVNGTKVTFTAGDHHYSLAVDSYSGGNPTLGDADNGGALIATLQEEGFAGYTVPESVKGNYHTKNNNVTVTVGDTITATIGGKEVTFTVTNLETSGTTVTIRLTTDEGGEGYITFDEGNGADIPASYTLFWQGADEESGTMYELTKEGEEEVPDHPLAGNYKVQQGSPLGEPSVVVTADGKMTVGTLDVNLTESEGSYTCTIRKNTCTVEFTDTFGNDVLVISGNFGTLYAIRVGVGPAVELNLLLGTWRTADGMHTVDVSADGITYDDVAVYVYGYYKNGDGPNTGYKFISGNTPYNFYSNDGTTATFAKLDAASSTTYTKDGNAPSAVATAEWKASYSWMLTTDKPWTAKANGDAGDYEITITLDSSDHFVITLSIGGVEKTVSSVKTGRALSELTFRVDGGSEDWILSATGSVAEENCQLSLKDPTSWPYNHTLTLKTDDAGGGGGGGGDVGDDGTYTFSPNLPADYVGVWTGTDFKNRHWTVTATENSIKIECDGVVQTLTNITSYGPTSQYGLEFKIDGSSCSFWNNGNQVLQITSLGVENQWVALTKA